MGRGSSSRTRWRPLASLLVLLSGCAPQGIIVEPRASGGGGRGGGQRDDAGIEPQPEPEPEPGVDAGIKRDTRPGTSPDMGVYVPVDAPPVTGPPPADPCVAAGTCPMGQWINVTPRGMAAADLRPSANSFGPGSIVGDPARPSNLYVGGSKSGLWRSTDYGNSWTKINSMTPDTARGMVIAVAGTTPATVWASGYNFLLKSTDGGMNFTRIPLTVELYSLNVDPNDANHLISGLHEADGIHESTDGGMTWRRVGGAGFPSGGVSWYPFFLNTKDGGTTRRTWFAIAQNAGSPIITRDGGANWTIPNGLRGLQHPHGCARIHSDWPNIFVGGIGGPGNGVYRSTDGGMNFTRVSGAGTQAVVWGTPKNVYAMYGWACSNCNVNHGFESAPQPGTTWSKASAPAGLSQGPNSLVVAYDGNKYVFVGLMWDLGIWKYVEP